MKIYKEGYSFAKPQRGDNETAHFETANPQNCRTFRPINYCILYSREETIALFKQIQANASTAIEFTDGGNPPNYSAKIYPEGTTISGLEYAEYILSLFEKNVNGYIALCNQRKDLLFQIDKLNKKLVQKPKSQLDFGKPSLVLSRICSARVRGQLLACPLTYISITADSFSADRTASQKVSLAPL